MHRLMKADNHEALAPSKLSGHFLFYHKLIIVTVGVAHICIAQHCVHYILCFTFYLFKMIGVMKV